MIALLDASRRIGIGAQARDILAPASLVFAPAEKVGILAPRGAGKSILARMLAGIDPPDGGAVLHEGRISWPVGFAGALHPDLSIAENLRLIARILGEDPQEMIAFCTRIAGLEDVADAALKTLSPAGRAALAFCVSMSVACDSYIADDTTGFGTGAQRDLSEAVFEKRLSGAGLILLSSNPRTITRFCDHVLVLLEARLVACPDAQTAADALDAIAQRNAATQRMTP